jgi:hypothetical protein
MQELPALFQFDDLNGLGFPVDEMGFDWFR